MSVRSNAPLRMRSATRAAFSASMVAAAFSTSATMSPMPRMRPAIARRIEILQRIEPLAGAHQLDRLAGDRAHRERGAAAPITVDAGEHDAGQPDPLVERAREVDGVLAGQRISDQQHLVRARGTLDLGGLGHHALVEGDAAGGIEEDHVIAAEPAGFERAARDLHRALACDDRQRID